MRILIIEDENPAANRLNKLLQNCLGDFELLDVLDSVETAVKWFQKSNNPDLIFMDIQLADGLSFEIFEQVDIQIPIIFTTAYDEYTLKAFKVNSIDYLLKPIDEGELLKSIQKLDQFKEQFNNNSLNINHLLESLHIQKKDYKSRFLVKMGDRLISVPADQIAYFYAEQKVVILVTKEQKKYTVDYSLDELENILNPDNFFRLNRQYIARIHAIKSIHNYFKSKIKVFLEPDHPHEIIISRERSPYFKKWLDQ